jgi:quercetin dioxygenase-like cupin family protein
MMNVKMIPPAEAVSLQSLIPPTAQGIARYSVAKGAGVTVFAFDAGRGLDEHTSPFDALVMVLDGALTLTIGGVPVQATPGVVVRLPGGVPHALQATVACRMLLIVLPDATEAARG